MRILIVSGSLPSTACGVGDYAHALATALADLGGNTVAVLTGPADRERDCGAPPYEVLRPVRSWRLREAADAWRSIRRWRPDVVHVQYPTRGYGSGWLPSVIGLLAASTGARLVRTWHEAFPRSQATRFLVQSFAPGPYITVRPNFSDLMWRPLRGFLKFRRSVLIHGASAIPQSRLSGDRLGVVRSRLLGDARRLIVFFGFLFPNKGVEDLFDVAEPVFDRLLIVGEDRGDPAYAARLKAIAESAKWKDRARLTGFLAPDETADILAAADMAVLPFREGGGVWNSSIHAAALQATPVVTTTRTVPSSDPSGLVHHVHIGDREAMRDAMNAVAPWNLDRLEQRPQNDWARVAREHMAIYASMKSAFPRALWVAA